MHEVSRRAFLKNAMVGTTALLAGCTLEEEVRHEAEIDRVPLGKTGLVVPRLALGTGTHGWKKVSDQTRLGQAGFTRLMAHGAERGAAFIDAADLYGSHGFVKHALADGSISRDDVVILSKIWFGEAPEMTPTTTARPEVERFLKEMGVDHIDICLIHCVQDPLWPEHLERMRDELSRLKEKGLVRAVGCSSHTQAALDVAVDHPWVDVVLARVNPEGKRMDPAVTPEARAETLKRAKARGKGVLGMKIYGCGDLSSRERRYASLDYVLRNDLVDAMTIGFDAPEQIDDTATGIRRALS